MYERGELVLIPYPFTDLSTQKKRPVLVLTKPDKQGDFTALPVTSRGHHKQSVSLVNKLDAGQLPKTSWVRTDRIVTLHQSLIFKSFAMCSESLINEIMEDLCHYLGYKS
jgi:mRNA interferase MazF